MTNQQEQITLHHVNKYCGGPLAIRSIIYGCPNVRWNLVEDPDSWPITPGLIAWSYNREEVVALQQQLRLSTNSIHQPLERTTERENFLKWMDTCPLTNYEISELTSNSITYTFQFNSPDPDMDQLYDEVLSDLQK